MPGPRAGRRAALRAARSQRGGLPCTGRAVPHGRCLGAPSRSPSACCTPASGCAARRPRRARARALSWPPRPHAWRPCASLGAGALLRGGTEPRLFGQPLICPAGLVAAALSIARSRAHSASNPLQTFAVCPGLSGTAEFASGPALAARQTRRQDRTLHTRWGSIPWSGSETVLTCEPGAWLEAFSVGRHETFMMYRRISCFVAAGTWLACLVRSCNETGPWKDLH